MKETGLKASLVTNVTIDQDGYKIMAEISGLELLKTTDKFSTLLCERIFTDIKDAVVAEFMKRNQDSILANLDVGSVIKDVRAKIGDTLVEKAIGVKK